MRAEPTTPPNGILLPLALALAVLDVVQSLAALLGAPLELAFALALLFGAATWTVLR